MVVNEVTSSVQAKGTKTVIAVAAAMVAAGVTAAETAPTVDWTKDTSVTVTTGKVELGADMTNQTAGKTYKNTTVKDITVEGGELVITGPKRLINQGLTDSTFTVNAGKVTVCGNAGKDLTDATASRFDLAGTIDTNNVVIAGGEVTVGDGKNEYNYIGAYKTFRMTGGTVNLNKGSQMALWSDNDTEKDYAMVLSGGTINMTAAKIGAGDKEDGDMLRLAGTDIHVKAAEGAKDATVSRISATGVNHSAGMITVDEDAVLRVNGPRDTPEAGDDEYPNLDPDYYMSGTAKIFNKGVFEYNHNFVMTGGEVLNYGQFLDKSDGRTLKLTVSGGTFTNEWNFTADTVTVDGGTFATITKAAAATSTSGEKGFTVRHVNVEEGGTFKLLDFNSVYAKGTTFEPEGTQTETEDQYLIAGSMTLNLNGGTFVAADGKTVDRIKVGMLYNKDKEATNTGTLNVNGAYGFKTLVLGGAGSLTVKGDGDLTVETLDLSGMVATDAKGKMTNDGKLTIGTVVGTNAGEAFKAEAFVNNGEIYTGLTTLMTKGTDGKYSATAFAQALADDTGTVYETTYTGEYTSDDLKKAQKLVKNLAFANAVMKPLEGKDFVSAAEIAGLKAPGTAVGSDAAAVDFSQATGDTLFGTLNFTGKVTDAAVTITGKDAATVSITGAKTGGDLITAADAKVKSVKFSTGDFVLGSDATATTLGLAAEITAGVLKTKGTMTLTDVTVGAAGTLQVAGATTAASVAGEGTVAVEGGALAVAGQAPVSAETVPQAALFSAPVAAATAEASYDKAFAVETNYKITGVKDLDTNLPVKVGYLTLGDGSQTANNAALATLNRLDNFSPETIEAVLTINQKIDLTKGSIELGTPGSAANGNTPETGALKTAATSAVIVDVQGVASKNYDPQGAAGLITVTKASEINNLVLTNLTRDGFVYDEKSGAFKLDLGTNVTVAPGKVWVDNDFYTADFTAADNAVVVKADEAALKEVSESGLYIAGAVERDVRTMTRSGNPLVAAVIDGNAVNDAYNDTEAKKIVALGDAGRALEEAAGMTTTSYDIKKGRFDLTLVSDAALKAQLEDLNAQMDAVEKAAVAYEVASLNAAANMAVAGGAFSTALDVNDQVTASIARRTSLANLNVSRNEVGVTPWVDVFGTTNEAKTLYGNGAGYETDIYGAVLGFDYTASCGAILGVALNVGTADGNSVGNGVEVENDTDFYGLSIYASDKFGPFNVQADLGYSQTSNDMKTAGAFGAFDESLDADVFTFGVGTEFLASFGAVNVVPHAGIRLTTIDMDASKFGADYDKMTVWQMPLGVAFSGTFETGSWKVAPMVDVSVVPTFGDKDAVASFIGKDVTTRVVDSNPVQAKLGVSAQNGAWTFGVNYGLTAGSDDRMNNSFNANVRYTF